jgi:hypothetical protein
VLEVICSAAPPELQAETLEVIIRVSHPEAAVVSSVGLSIVTYLAAEEESPDLHHSIWWPDGTVDDAVAVLSTILARACPGETRFTVGPAFDEGLISASTAARLLHPSEVGSLLIEREAGSPRLELAQACLDTHEEEATPAIGDVLLNMSFEIDLAEAIAPIDSTYLFVRAGGAWPDLDSDERSRLVDLLEQHASNEDLSICEIVLADTTRANKALRVPRRESWRRT